MKAVAVLMCLFLVSCSGAPYKPMGGSVFQGDKGYLERKMPNGDYMVTFQGDGNNTDMQVYDFFIRRSAELAKQNGFTSFNVKSHKIAHKPIAFGVSWPKCEGLVKFTNKPNSNSFHVKNVLK